MKRAPVMKNAPQININDSVATAAPVSKNPAAPAVANLQSRLRGMTGNHITLSVCGRDVDFTLKTITAGMVERATMVWTGNERVQELLTESALADLMPSFTAAGQQNPAIGRIVNGVVEVADGSRRRQTAILTSNDYRVLVGDLDDDQMAWLSSIGNAYRPTSAYERGKRYARRLENEFDGNVSKLADDENISRKIIMRCIKTATLPTEMIRLFSSPNELSARAGESLAANYASNQQAVLDHARTLAKRKGDGEEIADEDILKELMHVSAKPKPAAPSLRTFGNGIKAKYNGNKVHFLLDRAPASLVSQIEALIEQHQQQAHKNISQEVNAALGEVDKLTILIREAAALVDYKITGTKLQAMIPFARNTFNESGDRDQQLLVVAEKIKQTYID